MMTKAKTPRTWEEVKRHPAVEYVEVNATDDVRYWVYLREGFTAASDPLGQLTQGNGRTVREAIEDVFPVSQDTPPKNRA